VLFSLLLRGEIKMFRLSLVVALLGLFCMPLFAQDLPKIEAYGGYQFLHAGTNTGFVGTTNVFTGSANGFIGAGEYNFSQNIGFVGEFGFGVKSENNVSTKDELVLGGLRMGYRSEKYRIFYNFLLGFNHAGGGASTSGSNAFAIAPLGGGIDFTINQRISIRPAQLDYVRIRLGSTKTGMYSTSYWANSFRYTGGVIIKLGAK
jgi:hypothetical protein